MNDDLKLLKIIHLLRQTMATMQAISLAGVCHVTVYVEQCDLVNTSDSILNHGNTMNDFFPHGMIFY